MSTCIFPIKPMERGISPGSEIYYLEFIVALVLRVNIIRQKSTECSGLWKT